MYERRYIFNAIGRVNDFSNQKIFSFVDLFDYNEWIIIKNKEKILKEFDNLIELCEDNLGIAKLNVEKNFIKGIYKNMDNSLSTKVFRQAILNLSNIVFEEFINQNKDDYNQIKEISFNFRHLFRYNEWINFEERNLREAEEKFKEIITKADILKIKESNDLLDYKLILK